MNSRCRAIESRCRDQNSSSKTVRDGTKKQHWFRRITKKGTTNWPTLNELVGIKEKTDLLTEDSFKTFVRKVITKNSSVLYLEEGIPWNAPKDDDKIPSLM